MKIVIDTETTGLHPEQGDEILQISIIDADTKTVVFNELIQPTTANQWPEAMAVNHITPEDVADKPTISAYKDELDVIFSGADEIIGYNTPFDLDFLSICAGVHPRDDCKIVDVMQEYAENYGVFDTVKQRYKWIKLIEAAEHMGYDWDIAHPHDSLGDVYATLYIYRTLRDTNLYYISIAYYSDTTTARSIDLYEGQAKRSLYRMEQNNDKITHSEIIAVDQEGKPHVIVQHPLDWR